MGQCTNTLPGPKSPEHHKAVDIHHYNILRQYAWTIAFANDGKVKSPASIRSTGTCNKSRLPRDKQVTVSAFADLATAQLQCQSVLVQHQHTGQLCQEFLWPGDAGLRKHFENTVSSVGGSLRSVKVALRKGPDGKALSMGFGFVECSSEDVAKAVLKRQQVSGAVLLQALFEEQELALMFTRHVS